MICIFEKSKHSYIYGPAKMFIDQIEVSAGDRTLNLAVIITNITIFVMKS